MKVLILTSSPNKDGLTATCGKFAYDGVVEGGAEGDIININSLDIGNCHACNNGWGTCSSTHECQVKDDFQALHQSFNKYDAFIFVTPVYWGDMSESVKAFVDRLRRCEATNKARNLVEGKPFICVAAAGGTGNGTMSTLSSMERLVSHIRAERFDLISITRKSKDFKLETIKESAKKMVLSNI